MKKGKKKNSSHHPPSTIHELATLYELSTTLATALDFNSILSIALDKLKRMLPFHPATSTIMLLDDTKTAFHFKPPFVLGIPPQHIQEFVLKVESIEKSKMRLLEKNIPLLINDLNKEPDVQKLLIRKDLKSFFAFPLVSKKELLGIITLSSTTKAKLTKKIVKFFQSATNIIAAAILNVKLYQDLHERLVQLDGLYKAGNAVTSSLDLKDILTTVMQGVRAGLSFDRAAVFFVDGEEATIKGKIGTDEYGNIENIEYQVFPLKEGDSNLADIALGKAEAFFTENAWATLGQREKQYLARGVTQNAVVPMTVKNKIIGMIAVDNLISKKRISEKNFQLLKTFANQAAIAVENAALFQECTLAEDRERQAYIRAEAERNKLEAIIQSVADAIIVVDNEQRIIKLNHGAEKMFALKKGKIEGVVLKEVINIHPLNELMGKAFNAPQEVIKGAFTLPATDIQKERFCEALFASVYDNNGKTVGIVSVIRDITKEKDLDQMRSNFLASISHELRTPLTSVIGYSELLLSGKLGPLNTDKQRRSLERINTQGKFLLNLINNLLGLSKMEEVEFKLVKTEEDLKTIIDDVLSGINPLLIEKSLLLSLDLPQEFPSLLMDREKIQQVFINLFDNAIKYTPRGGKINLSSSQNKQWVQIDISDSGEGIPLNKITHVFDRFYQVGSSTSQRVGGVGLGLAIVKEIVEGHGGRVWTESNSNEGSTFSFYIPKPKDPRVPTITLAYFPCAANIILPYLYLHENQNFKGFNLELKKVEEFPQFQELLEKREISGGLIDPALVIFLKKIGLPVKILQWASRCGSTFILGKECIKEKVFTEERKTIGIPNRFSLENILTHKTLKNAKIFPFPPLTLMEMLKEGEIEGVFLPEPFSTWAEILGIGRSATFACQVLPHLPSSSFFVLEDVFFQQKAFFEQILEVFNKNLKDFSSKASDQINLCAPFLGLPRIAMVNLFADQRRVPHFHELKSTFRELKSIFEEMVVLGLIEEVAFKVEDLLFLTEPPFHTNSNIS